MQEILEAVNRYALRGGSKHSDRPSQQFLCGQFLSSLMRRGMPNYFCLLAVADFMYNDESLVVASRDAIQSIICSGPVLLANNSISNPFPDEITAVTAAGSSAIVCNTNGVSCFTKELRRAQEFVFSGFAQNILCVAATPDGSCFATGGGNATVTVWSSDMKALHYLSGHTDWVRFVKFSIGSGELQLFSAGDDGVICQWDPIAGAPLSHVDYSRGQSILAFEVSFRRGLMAISCNTPVIALYKCKGGMSSSSDHAMLHDDLLQLQQVGLITNAHRSTPTILKFTEDAQWLVSAAEDETLAVSSVEEPRRLFMCWELVTRRHCLTFMNTFTAITVLASPPQSSVIIIAACASDGTVIQWIVDPRDGRTTYIKKLQLHLGALLAMDVVR